MLERTISLPHARTNVKAQIFYNLNGRQNSSVLWSEKKKMLKRTNKAFRERTMHPEEARKSEANHQGISWPSHAKNLPLSLSFTLLIMLSSFPTENSLVKSLLSGTFLWNGLDRSVSTVPGCSKMQATGSFFLASSTAIVFVTTQSQ